MASAGNFPRSRHCRWAAPYFVALIVPRHTVPSLTARHHTTCTAYYSVHRTTVYIVLQCTSYYNVHRPTASHPTSSHLMPLPHPIALRPATPSPCASLHSFYCTHPTARHPTAQHPPSASTDLSVAQHLWRHPRTRNLAPHLAPLKRLPSYQHFSGWGPPPNAHSDAAADSSVTRRCFAQPYCPWRRELAHFPDASDRREVSR